MRLNIAGQLLSAGSIARTEMHFSLFDFAVDLDGTTQLPIEWRMHLQCSKAVLGVATN